MQSAVHAPPTAQSFSFIQASSYVPTPVFTPVQPVATPQFAFVTPSTFQPGLAQSIPYQRPSQAIPILNPNAEQLSYAQSQSLEEVQQAPNEPPDAESSDQARQSESITEPAPSPMQQDPAPSTSQEKTYTQAEFEAFTQALLKQQADMFAQFTQQFSQTMPATSQPPTFQRPLEDPSYSQRPSRHRQLPRDYQTTSSYSSKQDSPSRYSQSSRHHARSKTPRYDSRDPRPIHRDRSPRHQDSRNRRPDSHYRDRQPAERQQPPRPTSKPVPLLSLKPPPMPTLTTTSIRDRVSRIDQPSFQTTTHLRQPISRTEPSSSQPSYSQQHIQVQRTDNTIVTIPAETRSSRQPSSQRPSSSRPILGQHRQPTPLCPELSRQSSSKLRSTIVIPPTTTLSRTTSSLPKFTRGKPFDYV